MTKKLIQKTFYENVKDVPDKDLPESFIKESANAVILRFQYKEFIMYYPVSTQTATGKTKAQLFKLFVGDFIKGYNEAIATKEDL